MVHVIHRVRLVSLVGAVLMAACKNDAPPTPVPEKAPLSSASPAPSALSSAKAAIPLPDPTASKDVPTWAPEPFAFQGGNPEGIYVMDDGTLAVSEKRRVGRVLEDKIEWLSVEAPNTNSSMGSTVYWVGGRWPDAVDVICKSNNARAPAPTFHPLTGKGATITFVGGGGPGDLLGIARIGESTLAGGVEHVYAKFGTVRGPAIIRARKLFDEAGCTKNDLSFDWRHPEYPAVLPIAFGGTGAGTVISMGQLCTSRNATLEVWEKESKTSKFIDLGPDVGVVEPMSSQVIAGKGDEAWLLPNAKFALHYVGGKVEKMPEVPQGTGRLFVSPNGKLYAANAWGIHRWEKDHWTQIARFAWAEENPNFLADVQERIWRNAYSVRIMRETTSADINDACKTPFVHLYDVAADNKADFTFPSTRKALASFPEVADVTLVEFKQDKRRLGLIVKSKTQGEAVLAFLKTAMPKEMPRLLCYEPKELRKIEMDAKGK